MKKFSVLLGMLLYAFAWIISPVSANGVTINFGSTVVNFIQDGAGNITMEVDGAAQGTTDYTNTAAAPGACVITRSSMEGYVSINHHTADGIIADNIASDGSKTFQLEAGQKLEVHLMNNSYAYIGTAEISVPAASAAASVSDEPYIYTYPEDEKGQYYLTDDGKIEYCSFQSYEICLFYMGDPDVCERYRR